MCMQHWNGTQSAAAAYQIVFADGLPQQESKLHTGLEPLDAGHLQQALLEPFLLLLQEMQLQSRSPEEVLLQL